MEIKKYNILFLTAASHIAGGEINLISLLNSIDKKKFNCHILFQPESKFNEHLIAKHLNEFNFVPYRKDNSIAIIFMVIRFVNYLLKHNINCVYANTIIALKAFWPILNLLKIPVFAHIHIDESDQSLRWLKINNAKRIVVCSNFLKQQLLAHSQWIDRNKIYSVLNAIDKDIWFPKDYNLIREELKVASNVPIVGIVGQLKKIKGQELFLKMIKVLNDKGYKSKYVIIGDDNIEKDRYLNFLIQMANELKINNVQFLGYRKDIPQVMSDIDLLVCPSLREPFGRVVIEAMACGTPVIASAVGGIPEIFKDKEGGCFFKTGNINDLVEKTILFFENKEWWEKQKQIAFQHAHKNFSQEKHTKEIEKHLLEILQ